MVSSLTTAQFKEVLQEVNKNHSLIKGRAIKYLDSSFDFRTLSFWRIEFRGFAGNKVFTVTNRGEMVDGEYLADIGNLYDEIMQWLKEGEK